MPARVSRAASGLAGLAVWAVLTPYVGSVLGVEIGVSDTTEVIDHVIPGLVVVVAALAARGVHARSGRALLTASAGLLGALMIAVSHAPLLLDAGTPPVTWLEALWHAWPGFALVAVAAWALAAELRADSA